jgi:hypothetical protein
MHKDIDGGMQCEYEHDTEVFSASSAAFFAAFAIEGPCVPDFVIFENFAPPASANFMVEAFYHA